MLVTNLGDVMTLEHSLSNQWSLALYNGSSKNDDNTPQKNITSLKYKARSIASHPQRNLIATGSQKGVVRFYSYKQWNEAITLIGKYRLSSALESHVEFISFQIKSEQCVAWCDGKAWIIDADNGVIGFFPSPNFKSYMWLDEMHLISVEKLEDGARDTSTSSQLRCVGFKEWQINESGQLYQASYKV